ncbi:DNA replication complex GINS protein psf2 [Schizosaccharomyces pombe]|uniref:DNA replication complex GINS protein psf2 n=1 Tax=Schizosaccharomyces pombe (strain 972 / ATCC 24843) TaxID=284812 RepID=PSF2_SCHPO|nr:GINS complex subunit Psf2 [Schizosaccharomyces pombe]O94329.1 RecName: Full=DNA replication complex GINS protein psf2 [Schizosaccharomyces pombe 972h-]CAA22185.1 GINS complex subunit Psf2 [Schizosaccharomyces pombe]|eukprot:NP_595493.1 GINS complex subunit Psf2 [Schizosaccharomyces pombe]
MALPRELEISFSPEEMEFLAGNEYINIVPSETMDQLPLVSATIPIMKPPKKCRVPLWLALELKKQNLARIVPPEWMEIGKLENIRDDELENETFSELPFRWLETAHLLLNFCADDIEDVEDIRRILLDIREARQSKARTGLEAINEVQLTLDNLGAMEINEIRPIFREVMDRMRKIVQVSQEE